MKRQYKKSCLKGLNFIFTIVILLGIKPLANAQFTPGRVVVAQTVTTSATSYSSKEGSPITLNEYDTTIGNAGITVTIPSTGTNALRMAGGSGGSEGFLTRSTDGTFLVVTGYNRTTDTVDITATYSTVSPRAIGKVDAAGNYTLLDTSKSFYSANDIRGGISDGTNFWVSGASVAGKDGINYFVNGSHRALGTSAKAYGLQIFNNQIFFSTQKVVATVTPSLGIYSLGTGLPTSGTITPTLLFSTGSATPLDFSIDPTGTICYVAINGPTASAGIQKWTKTSGTWSLAYTLSVGGPAGTGAFGMVVDYSGTNPVIYATTTEAANATSGNRLIKLRDTGASSTYTNLVNSTPSVFLHGVAFSPSCPIPAQPADFTVSSAMVSQGQTAVAYTVPNDPIATTYNWSYITGTGATINGATNNVTVDFSSTATAGTLKVTAQNSCGTSDPRSIDISIAGSMRITEYMYNGKEGPNTVGEYVEFTNVGGTAVDMSGWSFDDSSEQPGSQSLSAFGIVQPGESVILTDTTAAGFRGNWGLCPGIKVIGGNSNNLGRSDEINLYNGTTLVDRLTYNDQAALGPRTNGTSAWVTAAGLGINNATLLTLSSVGDAENSHTSQLSEIGNPGYSKRATVSFDPCYVANNAPTIVMDVVNTSNFLDGAVAVSPASPYGLSGVINDPTDPASTLGINFTINDVETAVGSLTVTVTSSNTTVVPNAGLSLTGTGASRNLKITPSAVGYSTITVNVSDGTNTTPYVLSYAASGASTTPSSTFWHTGMSDASDGIPLDDNYYISGDDELNVLNVYSRNESGLPLVSYDYTSYLNLSNPTKPEVDLEAGTVSPTNPNKIYWTGSMSTTKAPFAIAPNRDHIFATIVSGTGAATTFTFSGYYANLREDIVAWGTTNGLKLDSSAAAGVDSKQKYGFATEGMVFGPDGTTLYICMRAPLAPSARTKALIVPITNFESWFNNGAPSGTAPLAAPILLDMGGRGFRDVIRLSNGTYIIVAGNPAGDPITSAIYKWTGKSTDAPIMVTTSANGILNLEGVMPINVSGKLSLNELQVISDGGDDDLYNDGSEAKDFNDLILRKFRSDVLTSLDLCLPLTSDTAATVCNSFTWHGTSYTSSATPTHTFTNSFGCDSIVTLALTINTCTDVIDANASSDVQLTPNPNTGNVTIKLSGKNQISSLSIYNVSGIKVKDIQIQEGTTELPLDINDLNSGLYTLILKDQTGKQLLKRMIKN